VLAKRKIKVNRAVGAGVAGFSSVADIPVCIITVPVEMSTSESGQFFPCM
jgi:hypothetical protein